MLSVKKAASVHSNFNLKNVTVELLQTNERQVEHAFISISDLEAIRTSRQPLSASKHGLEVICGASCDTGAQ